MQLEVGGLRLDTSGYRGGEVLAPESVLARHIPAESASERELMNERINEKWTTYGGGRKSFRNDRASLRCSLDVASMRSRSSQKLT